MVITSLSCTNHNNQYTCECINNNNIIIFTDFHKKRVMAYCWVKWWSVLENIYMCVLQKTITIGTHWVKNNMKLYPANIYIIIYAVMHYWLTDDANTIVQNTLTKWLVCLTQHNTYIYNSLNAATPNSLLLQIHLQESG